MPPPAALTTFLPPANAVRDESGDPPPYTSGEEPSVALRTLPPAVFGPTLHTIRVVESPRAGTGSRPYRQERVSLRSPGLERSARVITRPSLLTAQVLATPSPPTGIRRAEQGRQYRPQPRRTYRDLQSEDDIASLYSEPLLSRRSKNFPLIVFYLTLTGLVTIIVAAAAYSVLQQHKSAKRPEN